MNSPKQIEVDKNFEYFLSVLMDILPLHAGKYALLKNQKIIEYFHNLEDAQKYAEALYPDGLFSVQKVDGTPIRLGFIGEVIYA